VPNILIENLIQTRTRVEMRQIDSTIRVLPAAILILVLAAAYVYAQSDYVGGNAEATRITEPGLEGYWEYCITIHWDTSEYSGGASGQSHVSMILGLEDCLALCGDACFIFPDTVGVSDGVDGCDVYYYAELDLNGDPTVPPMTSTLKFEPYPAECEPDVSGMASVCFYSMFPPRISDSNPGSMWIKFGQFSEEGLITGQLPSCSTAANEETTWGGVKRLFR
jgi:hypothetical protein